MKTLLGKFFLSLAVILPLLPTAVAAESAETKPTESAKKEASRPAPVPTRILLVSQSAGFKHSVVNRKSSDKSHAERVMIELGIRSGEFRIDCTQDVEKEFTPELLKNYNIVMFYTTGKLPIPPKTLDWFLNTWG